MRVDLRVPYAEKDHAKSLGARWDDARKVWYAENRTNMQPFLRWIKHTALLAPCAPGTPPTKHKRPPPDRPVSNKKARRRAAALQAQIDRSDKSKPPALTRQGKTITGQHIAPSCGCQALPWDDCEHTVAEPDALARELDHKAREHMRSMSIS